ncbi:MAG: 30S ribosomal protein S18 [Firmicutes bacterium]|nr:30S ribosomal protein S18 [Bacillota bacterium]
MSEEQIQPEKKKSAPSVAAATQKPKRRPCGFCMEKNVYIDYKDPRLKKYMTENGKIVSRRQTGLCAAHQRELTTAVKRARTMSII